MTAPKHTPGPWFSDGTHVFVDSRYQVCCGRAGYECCGQPDVSGDYFQIAETSECNAPIIAAAPDLHSALAALIDDFGDAEGPLIDKAKAALAKARGESI